MHATPTEYLAECGLLARRAGLAGLGALDALADGVRGFSGLGAREVLVFYGGDFDVDIDAVQERAGDAVAVALDIHLAAPAFTFRISKVPAFARMEVAVS